MKQFTCLILAILMLLCSCNPAVGIDKESDSFQQSEKQTAAVSRDTVAVSEVSAADAASTTDDDDTELTAVRYEKKYEIKRVTDGMVANYADRMYVYNEFLYHIISDYQMKEDILYAVIRMYDAEGQLSATERLALPESSDGRLPEKIYKLSDGRYFLFFITHTFKGLSDGFFQLLDIDGNEQYRYEIKETRGLSQLSIRLYEDGDGGFSVCYHADSQFVMLDETLTQTMCFSTGCRGTKFIRMDENNFLLMFDTSETYRANVQLGYSTVYGLHLPKSFENQTVFCGANEALYIAVPNGLYRYDQDRQPEQVLSWMDLGLTDLNTNDSAEYNLWIIDDTRMYLAYRQSIDGRTSDVSYLITVEEVPVTGDKTDLVLECFSYESLPWLEKVIRDFNLANPTYRVKLNYLDARISAEEEDAYLQKRLLSSSPPDIFISFSDRLAQKYYDKNAFVDLMPLLDDRVLGGVRDAYLYNGALYEMPIGMWVNTLVSIDAVCDSALTWDQLYEITDGLAGGECLMTWPLAEELFMASMMDFVDFENKTSDFNSTEYRLAVEYLETMDSYCEKDLVSVGNGDFTFNGKWGISNGALIPYLRNGAIKLLDFSIKDIQAYAALKLIYGDTPFTLCGYPSRNGEGSGGLYGFYSASVLQSTQHADGCMSFIEALFSVEAQTNPSLTEENYLPVTRDSLEVLIDNARYQYYQTGNIIAVEAFQNGTLVLEWDGTSAEYLDDFGFENDTSKGYTVCEYTEEDKQAILSFFDNCSFGTTADEKIREIVIEEISYYAGQARSLTETTKIIDSRVWIYLNE